ncbi:MAG: hypothetical protein RPU39_13610 [Candidatus Sedimenticola sp. (ex Thyasira tokunagai)]
MKNLWPEGFKPSKVNAPKKILEEQSALLPQLTGDMVYAKVKNMDAVDAIMKDHSNDFSYSYYLHGKFLKKYSFKAFDFSHSITMYPVRISIDEHIASELGAEQVSQAENEDEFVRIIESVFNSERIKNIIGSIIQISGAIGDA